MRFGRALLAGMGWAALLGGLALCVLVFLSAYVAFRGDRHGVGSRDDGAVELPSVPDTEVPAVPLGRPPAPTPAAPEGAAAPGRATPRPRPATPRRDAPTPTAPAPGAGDGNPPASGSPSPAPAQPAPSGSGGGDGGTSAIPPPQRPAAPPTLGDTASDVTNVVGTEVGRVVPQAGEVIVETGDTAGDAIDAIVPPGLIPGPEPVSP